MGTFESRYTSSPRQLDKEMVTFARPNGAFHFHPLKRRTELNELLVAMQRLITLQNAIVDDEAKTELQHIVDMR